MNMSLAGILIHSKECLLFPNTVVLCKAFCTNYFSNCIWGIRPMSCTKRNVKSLLSFFPTGYNESTLEDDIPTRLDHLSRSSRL